MIFFLYSYYFLIIEVDWDLQSAALHLSDDTQKADIITEAEKQAAEEAGSDGQDKRLSDDSEEAQQLPAYLLSYNEDYFNQLFQLLNLNSDVVSPKGIYLYLYFIFFGYLIYCLYLFAAYF